MNESTKKHRDMILEEYRELLETHVLAINTIAAAKQWLDAIGEYRPDSPAGRFAAEYQKLLDSIDAKK